MTRSAPIALLFVAGCVAGPSQDALARATARQAVAEVVATRFPGVPIAPVTDCVIDNASAAELVRVAADSSGGRPGADTAEVIRNIATRPATIDCFGSRALPALLS